MHIIILHQAASDESAVDEQDVLAQRDAVLAALVRLGHEVSVIPCTLGLDRLRDNLTLDRPDLAFNLVESLGGSDRLISVVPLLLETLAIPYTGAPAAAMLHTSSKIRAKEGLVRAGLPHYNKNNILQYIAHKYHVTQQNIIYVGNGADGSNLLKDAGIGVAFDSTVPCIEKIADKLITGPYLAPLLSIAQASPEKFRLKLPPISKKQARRIGIGSLVALASAGLVYLAARQIKKNGNGRQLATLN